MRAASPGLVLPDPEAHPAINSAERSAIAPVLTLGTRRDIIPQEYATHAIHGIVAHGETKNRTADVVFPLI
jgi:hypothetical protein